MYEYNKLKMQKLGWYTITLLLVHRYNAVLSSYFWLQLRIFLTFYQRNIRSTDLNFCQKFVFFAHGTKSVLFCQKNSRVFVTCICLCPNFSIFFEAFSYFLNFEKQTGCICTREPKWISGIFWQKKKKKPALFGPPDQ